MLTKDPEGSLAEQYIQAITPAPPPPVQHAQPKRSASEWERDKIELAELKHAKFVIRTQEFPPYFDTEEGKPLY